MQEVEVQKSSCGALLRGTLRNADIEDFKELMCRKRKLIKVSLDAKVYGTDLPQTYGYSRFDSAQEYTDFMQSLQMKGMSMRGGFDLGSSFASMSADLAKATTKTKDSFHMAYNRHLYTNQIVYQVIPVASFQFDKSKLVLSDEARASLKPFCSLIWKSYKNERNGTNVNDKRKEKYTECTNFFEAFGPYINVSVFHFGGILVWKSTFCSTTDSHLEEISSLVASSLQAHVKAGFTGFGAGAGIDVSANHYKSQIDSKGKFSTTDIEKTMLSCDMYGGHPSFSFKDWLESLSPKNPNLIIINRGDVNNQDYIGAWDILNQDPWYLENDFVTNTNNGFKMNREERAQMREIVCASMFENFKTWIFRKKIETILSNVGEMPTSEEYIMALLRIEAAINRHENGDPMWLEFLQDDERITKFLLKPPNLKSLSRSDITKIQTIIKRLAKTIEDKNFLNKDDVLKACSTSGDIEESIDMRANIRRILTGAEKAKDSCFYRGQLEALVQLVHGSVSAYKTEWIRMLRLDDGIGRAILQHEPYMSMSIGKLEETEEQLEKLLAIEMVIESGNLQYFAQLREIKLKTSARISFRKNLSCLIEEAIKTTDGRVFLEVLQNICREVQHLEAVIGSIDDYLHYVDSKSTKIEARSRPPVQSNNNQSSNNTTDAESVDDPDYDSSCEKLPGIFMKPFSRYLDVSPETFKKIEEKVGYLLKPAPTRSKESVLNLIDDKMYLCIKTRYEITQIKDKAMATHNEKIYLNSLQKIKEKVTQLEKDNLLDEWAVIMTGDTSMSDCLHKSTSINHEKGERNPIVDDLLQCIPNQLIAREFFDSLDDKKK